MSNEDDEGRAGSKPDYAALDLPEDTPKDEWHWSHRRAYVYQRLEEEGHHSLLNKKEIANQFDVTRKTIYRDLDKISEYMTNQIDTTWQKSQSMVVFERAIRGLIDQGDFKEAAQVRTMYDDWLERRGKLDAEEETVQLEHSLDDDVKDMLDDVF